MRKNLSTLFFRRLQTLPILLALILLLFAGLGGGWLYLQTQNSQEDLSKISVALPILQKGEKAFETTGVPEAIEILTPLANHPEKTNEVERATDLILQYQKHESKRQNLLKDLEKAKEAKMWREAEEILNYLLKVHVPQTRTKQYQSLSKEHENLEEKFERAHQELLNWQQALTEKIEKCREHFQQRKYFLSEKLVQELEGISLPPSIESKGSLQKKEEALQFTESMRKSLLAVRKQQETKDVLVRLTQKYKQQLLQSSDLPNAAQNILRDKEFVGVYTRLIKTPNITQAEDPIGKLYGLKILEKELQSFVNTFSTPEYSHLQSSNFLQNFENFLQKVTADRHLLETEFGEYWQFYENHLQNSK